MQVPAPGAPYRDIVEYAKTYDAEEIEGKSFGVGRPVAGLGSKDFRSA